MESYASYLKKTTESLVKDIGIDRACEVTGKSKATLGRYYSTAEEHEGRFMPVDTVYELEMAASYPYVTEALAELTGGAIETVGRGHNKGPDEGHVNSDVVHLSERFGIIMGEYHRAISDGKITGAEAKRLLQETHEIQKVLVEMKRHLENEAV